MIATGRGSARLDELQALARPRAIALDPRELGTVRRTRHAFSRSFLRVAARDRWRVVTETRDLDADGRGTVVYRVEMGDRTCRAVVLSTVIDEAERTDRVIASQWDAAIALVEGELDAARLDDLRANLPRQEDGRACAGTLVWGRANRSARFFDMVVERLAVGLQPDPSAIGDAAYLIRSTAFYANGKWGLADFDGIDDDHPLRLPYRAQMLAAWLFREFSLELVEHCARARSADAVPLDAAWRRHFGIGNATGLGMVPYVINHPRVMDAWVALRELPLAHALQREPAAGDLWRLVGMLERTRRYLGEQTELETAPYMTGPAIADALGPVLDLARDLEAGRASAASPFRALHDRAAEQGVETRQIVDALIVELDEELDDEMEALLVRDERLRLDPSRTCGEVLERIEADYAWTRAWDFADPEETAMFWFYSESSQEPRRARAGDPGEDVQMPIGVARDVQALEADLRAADPDLPIGDLLAERPWHRGAVERVEGLADAPYAEAHVNPLSSRFMPLDLQRFQLVAYGMDNFNPQSTDWLRVTLYGGAPRADDVAAGVDDDWQFAPRPAASA
jgi:hypothetical protein